MDLRPGILVGPKLRLVRPLGEGGMGSVWVAEHLGLGAEVAVKFIAGENGPDEPASRARFEREASAAAKVRSPHVVRIFDTGLAQDGSPYIVMELCEGESLAARLGRAAPLAPADVRALVEQVADALGEAHELGIVHRDIKPGNIFLARAAKGPFAKVLDFGVAKQSALPAGLVTSTGAMVGTPAYMSPEQISTPRAVDRSADLWALAVVAYEALTGTLPFAGETVGALCIAIEKGRFAAPSSLRPELGATLDAWFARALGRNPEERFGSAAELAASFGRAIEPLCAAGDETESERRGQDGCWDAAGPTTGVAATLPARYARLPGPGEGDGEGPAAPPHRRLLRPALAALAVTALLATAAGLMRLGRDSPSAAPGAAAPGTGPAVVPSAAPPQLPAASAPSAAPPPASVVSPASSVAAPPSGRQLARPAAAAAAPSAPSSAPAGPAPGCTEPFYVDPQGIMRPKPECL